MEYVQIVRALALNTLTIPSNETTTTLQLLHPSTKVDLPPFVSDFHLKTKVILYQETFNSTLACSPRLSSIGPSNMMYELL
jgi:hypothetical protein